MDSSTPPNSKNPANEIESATYIDSFDQTFDIIVAGYGFAGGIAAIEAADAGADVVLLEKEDVPGGISITSGGGIRCTSDPRAAFEYLRTTNAGRVPDQVIKALADGMERLPSYIRELAKVNDAEIVVHDGPDKRANYPFPGGDAMHFVEVESVPGFDVKEAYPYITGRGGARMFKVIDDNLTSRDVPVWMETRAVQLITDKRGKEVRGIVVTRNGEDIALKARNGVILACGGFENNEWMKKQYFESMPVAPVVANNTGDGIMMAMDLGADLWHMWHFHGGYGFEHPNPECPFAIRVKRLPDWVPEESAAFVPSMGRHEDLDHDPHYVGDMEGAKADDKAVPLTWILLDNTGERFMNEYPPYLQDTGQRPMGKFDPHTQEFPRNPAFLICDDEARKLYPLGNPVQNSSDPNVVYDWSEDNQKEIENGILTQADTLAELAEKLGLDVDAVEESVDRWNELNERGEDADFGRPSVSMVPIEEPPFVGAEVRPVVSNTQGGPVRDERQQLISVTGDPIPRLYAAGEMSSPFGHLYMASGNLSDCIIGGWTAAREVAGLEPWDSNST